MKGAKKTQWGGRVGELRKKIFPEEKEIKNT